MPQWESFQKHWKVQTKIKLNSTFWFIFHLFGIIGRIAGIMITEALCVSSRSGQLNEYEYGLDENKKYFV